MFAVETAARIKHFINQSNDNVHENLMRIKRSSRCRKKAVAAAAATTATYKCQSKNSNLQSASFRCACCALATKCRLPHEIPIPMKHNRININQKRNAYQRATRRIIHSGRRRKRIKMIDTITHMHTVSIAVNIESATILGDHLQTMYTSSCVIFMIDTLIHLISLNHILKYVCIRKLRVFFLPLVCECFA